MPTTDEKRKYKEGSCDSRKVSKQLSQEDLTAAYVPDIETKDDTIHLRVSLLIRVYQNFERNELL